MKANGVGRKKIILWGLGPVNRALAVSILNSKDFEIVGACSHISDHEKRDLGECVGLAHAGISIATTEGFTAISNADCVIVEHSPTQDGNQRNAIITGLLASGLNVISASASDLLTWPNADSDIAAISDACRGGNSTFHATGLFPQLMMERFALTLAKAMQTPEQVHVLQAIDCVDASPELWNDLYAGGLGRPKKDFQDSPWLESRAVHHAMHNVARQLGVDAQTLRIESTTETKTATRKQTLGKVALKKGDIVSLKVMHQAWRGDAPFLSCETHYYLGKENADFSEATPYGNLKTPYSFAVQVTGTPSKIEAQLEFEAVHPGTNPLAHVAAQGVLASIESVCEAEPGILLHDASPRYQLDQRLPAPKNQETPPKRDPQKPYRIVIWGPGEIGGAVTRAALQRKNLKIVGAKVFSPHKDGKDLGELVGIEPIGVPATLSADRIKALRPDCVIMTPQPRAIVEGLDDDVVDLLEAGINVITSAAYHNVTMPNWLASSQTPMELLREVADINGMARNKFERLAFGLNTRIMRMTGDGVLGTLLTPAVNALLAPALRKAMPFRATPDRLLAACHRGRSSLHGTGVHPTFMAERVGMQLATMVAEPQHVRFIEAADFSYMPDGMWGGLSSLGFGKPVDELDENYLIARAGDFYYGDVTGNMAHLLYGVPSTEVRLERRFRALPATRDFMVGSTLIRKGSAAALHMTHKGYIGDHHFFTNEECWYLGPELEYRGDDLPFGNFNTPISYTVEVSGKPSQVRMQLSMDGAGVAGQLFQQSDTSTADLRCALGQRMRTLGITNPITNATAMAILDAVAAVCDMEPGVVIDDIRPGFRQH